MIQSLTIDNYALIEHLEFAPTRGLTVITGETGAGKSIILGAIGLILGQRADAKTVRTGTNKCVIEASFDIAEYGLQDFFEENELEYDADHTIIRREILASGKSRSFVNDTPVQLSLLKQLGDALIDIHSQHQNLLISKDSYQQDIVDTLAGNEAELNNYQLQYKKLCNLRKQLAQLKETIEQNSQEADYIRFQFNQLDEANLNNEDELEELETEQELLSHAEEIKGGLFSMANSLNGDDNNLLSILRHICQEAKNLSRIYPTIKELGERLESDYIDIKDISDDIEDQADNVNFDPERLNFVEDRLGLLYSLLKKHKCDTVAELISLRNELNEQLLHIENSDEEIAELEAKLKEQTNSVKKAADFLTSSRKKAAKLLEQSLVEKVSYLGMPNIRFEVSIESRADFSQTGVDIIQFLFSANKNQPLKPCGEIASGGEISRLMLSIKALVAKAKTLPTIIFDEIDTGVSGDIAERMGLVMKQLADNIQVITITHLPQVAGKGDAHFVVYKEDSETDTTTHIVKLKNEERITEIARMLSGSTITEQAIANAKTLISAK